MPQLLTVRVERPGARRIRFWVPFLPVALLLAPLVVLGVLAACVVYSVSVERALSTGWRIVSALPGSRFDIEQGRTAVLVTIR